MDKGENGEVRYELSNGSGELFKVDRQTGDITLKQMLEGLNKEYQLTIKACDNGKIYNPLYTFISTVILAQKKKQAQSKFMESRNFV